MVESYFSKRSKLSSLYGVLWARRRNDDYDNYDRDYPQRDYNDRRSYDSRSEDYDRPEKPPSKKSKGAAAGGAALGVIVRIIFIILILAFFTMPQFEAQREKFYEYLMAGMYKYQEIPDSAEFSVERMFEIDSSGEINYTLYMPIPQDLRIDGDEAQKLKSVDFSPEPSEINEGKGEDNQWVWHGDMPTGGSDTITIIYHFKTAKIKWDISISKSGKIDDVPAEKFNRWGDDAWPVADYNDQADVDTDDDGVPDIEDVDDDNRDGVDKYRIEPSDPEIKELLLDILNDNDLYSGNNLLDIGHLNVYKVVKAIYDRIDDRCVYPDQQQQYDDNVRYGNYPKWATGTWDDKRGDCDDQSILFISLCRAAGIPAMLEIGALYDPNMDQWEGHGWANVYIPYSNSYAEKKGTDHVTPMVDIVNDIFLVRDPNRFSEWVDDGRGGRIDPETNEWEISNLEKRYLAWEYIRGDSSVDVDISEEYETLEFKAYPPEEKLYL